VRAAVHSPARAHLLPPSVTPVPLSTDDPATLAAAFQGVNRAFLVLPGGPQGPAGTRALAEAARDHGVERLVKLSSYDPESEPQTPTDRWALEAEAAVRDTGIPWTFLRPSWFNQNFHSGYFTPLLLRGALPLPFGEGRSGWIDCRDVAAVAVKALLEDGHAGQACTLTGPEALTLTEIAASLSRATERDIDYVDISDEAWVASGRAAGYPDEAVFGMLALMAKTRDGYAARLAPDVERILGRPPISFDQYAADHAAELTALVPPP
jgi:uncharacterized protein YbjT (DUF2867 family)